MQPSTVLSRKFIEHAQIERETSELLCELKARVAEVGGRPGPAAHEAIAAFKARRSPVFFNPTGEKP